MCHRHATGEHPKTFTSATREKARAQVLRLIEPVVLPTPNELGIIIDLVLIALVWSVELMNVERLNKNSLYCLLEKIFVSQYKHNPRTLR